MSKTEFLSGAVNEFVGWVAANLDSAEFAHAWTDRRRPQAEQWRCASVFDAYRQYQWSHRGVEYLKVPAGTNYASNAEALDALGAALMEALKSGNDDRTRAAAVAVMRWGGVTRGNVSWLSANQSGLADLLKKTRLALHKGDMAQTMLVSPRFNAGMTKVYSLICDDFIIYDSRVAAALAWMVARYQTTTGTSSTDLASLLFAVPPHYESPRARDPKRRRPDGTALAFPSLAPGAGYAGWNLKANWLLNAVLDHPNARTSGFASLGERRRQLRALEAALFMIGYDLPHAVDGTAAAPIQAPVAAAHPDEELSWSDCWTISERKEFEYAIRADGITTRLPDDSSYSQFTDKVINDTVKYLREQSPKGLFLLGNSADDHKGNIEKNGLGYAHYRATNRWSAPETSRLAAILVEIGVVAPPVGQIRGGDWRLTLDGSDLLNAAGDFDIRAVLNKMEDDNSDT